MFLLLLLRKWEIDDDSREHARVRQWIYLHFFEGRKLSNHISCEKLFYKDIRDIDRNVNCDMIYLFCKYLHGVELASHS
jgi:hypothetical protein